MKFEIPFDKDIYDEQMKLQFDKVWSKGFNKNKSTLYIAIPIFAVGVLAVYGKGNVGYVFIILGLFYLYKYYEYYQHYKNNKKRYFSESEIYANEQSEIKDISIFEFNDSYLRYKNYKLDFKLNWSLFTGFEIIKDNVFIKTKNVNHVYILGKSEIGSPEFNNVIEFLKSKMEETSA
ncbi:MAG: hypothetical protein V7719_18230 [Psychroserpens sp.]|uniref:hypothetical protein n=1 Tax=Psychroserpens sp. TaxID=2020870 RepID=UPI003002BCA2